MIEAKDSQTTEDIRRSEERFRLLVESVKDYAIFMLDVDGRIASWNEGAERIKGYTAQEIIGQHFSKFYPEEDIRAGKCEMELRVAKAEGRFEEEGLRIRKDGSTFFAHVVITALTAPGGEFVGFAKVTRDLTEKRKAEAIARELEREHAAHNASQAAERKLREGEDRYRELSRRLEVILENVSEGIAVQDVNGNVVFGNSAAAEVWGYETKEQLLQSTPSKVLSKLEIFRENGEPFPVEELPGRRALRGLEAPPALIRIRDRATGQNRWSRIRTALVREEGKATLAVNVFNDMTAQRRRHWELSFLAEASAALAASLDIEATLRTLARTVVPAFADWCAVDLLEGEELRHVAVAHVDPAKVELARAYQVR